MRTYRKCVVMLMAQLSGWARLWGQPGEEPEALQRAGRELREGQFDQADATASGLLTTPPTSTGALRIRGTVALWRNDVPSATAMLARAMEQTPRDRGTAALLAEALYRGGRFAEAALWFARAGRKAHAHKLASFGRVVPYRVDGSGGMVRFLQTNPLPLLEVTLNGGTLAVFLLDTGGGEVIVDSELAARLRLPTFGRDSGTFGGNTRAVLEHSRLASMQLGHTVIHDLPALIMPTRSLLSTVDGRGLDGIVGTTLLSRFLATINYPAGELHLVIPGRLRQEQESDVPPETRQVDVPFWLVQDHYIVARGALNHLPPQLFLIDTGVGGAAFAGPAHLLRSAGIRLGEAGLGATGGGRTKVRPFAIERLSLGAVERLGMQGLEGVFPESLENGLDVRIGGLICHDFFRGLCITFDFGRMRLRAGPP